MTLVFFFFKQKAAYEMRISDWSSDVCASDLAKQGAGDAARPALAGHGEADERLVVAVALVLHLRDGDVSLARHHRRVDHVHRVEHRRQPAAERYLGERPGVEVGEVALVLHGQLRRSEEHTSELQYLMRLSY